MTTIPISTMASHKNMIKAAANTFESIKKIDTQIETGKEYQNFSEIKPDALKLLNDLTNKLNTDENRLKNNKFLASKLGEYENTIQRLQEVLIEGINFIQTTLNSPGKINTAVVGEVSTQFINEIKGFLTNSFGGGYLFSGSKTDIYPISDIANISNIMPDGTITPNYYLGDDITPTQQISDTINLDYAITADNVVFQQFFAAFHYAKQFASTGDKKNLTESLRLLNEVTDGLNALMTALGSNSAILNRVIEDEESSIKTNQEIASSIIQIDPTFKYTELAPKIEKLQAIFMLTKKASEMFIGDYLR